MHGVPEPAIPVPQQRVFHDGPRGGLPERITRACGGKMRAPFGGVRPPLLPRVIDHLGPVLRRLFLTVGNPVVPQLFVVRPCDRHPRLKALPFRAVWGKGEIKPLGLGLFAQLLIGQNQEILGGFHTVPVHRVLVHRGPEQRGLVVVQLKALQLALGGRKRALRHRADLVACHDAEADIRRQPLHQLRYFLQEPGRRFGRWGCRVAAFGWKESVSLKVVVDVTPPIQNVLLKVLRRFNPLGHLVGVRNLCKRHPALSLCGFGELRQIKYFFQHYPFTFDAPAPDCRQYLGVHGVSVYAGVFAIVRFPHTLSFLCVRLLVGLTPEFFFERHVRSDFVRLSRAFLVA